MIRDFLTRLDRKQLIYYSLFTVLITLFGAVLAKAGLIFTLILLALPFAIGFAIWNFNNPKIGILIVLYVGFITNGLGRYIPAPMGLVIDAVLLITLLGTLFHARPDKMYRLKNTLMLIIGIWFIYTMLQVLNPEARSFAGWFYAVRGVSVYMMAYVPLILIWFDSEKDVDRFIHIWLIWSFVAAFWGWRQVFIGVDPFEKIWLDEGGAVTHVLHGKLRAFSFYSDAGQFGAAMGHIALVTMILGIGYKDNWKKRLYYVGASLICFYGMMLSGTRGALFVPLTGFVIFLLVIGNVRIISIGFIAGALFFCGLKYTYIGQSNDQIRRMRTALDPNDASLQVRLLNQAKLADYLKSRPFGGGIGSAGTWGQRFTPGTFLADMPLDSWYVKIWAESGIIGLGLFLILVLYVLIQGFIIIRKMPDCMLKWKMMALYSGFFGISFASYGNQIFGQSPTSMILYHSMAFLIVNGKLFLEQQQEQEKLRLTQPAS